MSAEKTIASVVADSFCITEPLTIKEEPIDSTAFASKSSNASEVTYRSSPMVVTLGMETFSMTELLITKSLTTPSKEGRLTVLSVVFLLVEMIEPNLKLPSCSRLSSPDKSAPL